MITYLGIELKLSPIPVSKTPWLLYRNEYWKPIIGYEDNYLISSHGRIKRLSSKVYKFNDYIFKFRGLNRAGYLITILREIGKKRRKFSVHNLMMKTFDYEGYLAIPKNPQVNHKNRIRHDNRLENLEWVSPSDNINHFFFNKDNSTRIKTSKYTGVSWNKQRNQWNAMLYLNGKQTNLGNYKTEDEAALAYKRCRINGGDVPRYAVLID